MHDDRLLTLIATDRRRLLRAATRLLGPMEAEDAVQDAYVRALEADLPELNVAQAWLLTVVRNLAIDRLRRRQWMQLWVAQTTDGDTTDGNTGMASPSAELDLALAQESAHALRWLAACLSPADGAAVLLHEVFEVSHAEMAQASGATEAGSRQQLRRALLRLRQAGGPARLRSRPQAELGEETVFYLYLQAFQQRDPHTLWAMLRPRPISALMGTTPMAARATPAPGTTACSVMQLGGHLGLVLTLDGVTLCVLPLGVQAERESEPAMLL
jgi:RNA polymerase sigma-70 factor (ECF subfamily)